MSDAVFQIEVEIDPSKSAPGVNRVDNALARLERRAQTTQAANDNLRGTFDRLGSGMDGAAGRGGKLGAIFDNIRDRAGSAAPEVANLTGTLAKFGPQAAVIAGVALAIGAVSAKAIEAAAKVEMWKANLLTITGSAQKAEESYAALVNFATRTPFDLGQAVEGFTKLRTLGLQATEGALMSFGNTAAAMGKPLSQMIEAVADAATGEFERLKEFGIKSKQEGDKVKFTFGGVSTSVGKDAASIQKYLENLGNTKFAGAMARQMDTIKGAMSNVEDAVFQAFAAIGGGQLGAAFKEILKSIAAGVSAATPMLASIGSVIGSIVGAVGSVLNSLGNLWLSLHGGASAGTDILTGLTVTFNLVAQGVEVFGNVVASVFGAISGVVSGVLGLFGDGFSDLLNWMGVSFESGGRSWTNSIVGIMRGVKFVVGQMPALFAIAINDVMGMFRNLGNVVSKILSAGSLKDVGAALSSIPGVISGSFKNTEKAMDAVGRSATRIKDDVKGADAAIGRLLGRNKTAAKLDTGSIIKQKPDAKKDKDKGKSDAEKKAEKEAEFWKTLQGEVETAKLLPLAAEDYRKQLELQKILGRDLIAGEKERIADLMQQARLAKIFTGMEVEHAKTGREIVEQEALLTLKKAGATEQQLAVEKAILDKRSAAIEAGATLATFQTDVWKAAEAQLRTDQTRLGVLGLQNKAIDDQAAKLTEMAQSGSTFGKDALRTNGSVSDRQGVAQADYAKVLASLKVARDSTDDKVKITAQEFQAGVNKAGEDFRATMAEIGTEFSQKMSRIAGFLDTIGGIIGGKLGSFVQNAGALSKSVGDFETTKTSIGDQFSKAFGANSPAIKGIGKAVGGAMAGMQIGEQMAGLTKALGIKTSGTGAKIGGAIGGAAFGPIGSIVGGLAGGILGGLFKKTAKGAAVITSGTSSTVTGNKGSVRDSLTGSVSSLQGGLQQLADQLGGELGAFRVSIGKYKDNYRVSSSGASNVDTKKSGKISGLVYDGKDEAAAIAAALQDAIMDGAITGLSDLMQKALKAGASNIDKAVTDALRIKDFEQAYKEMFDPIGAAADAITVPMKALRETLNAVGASTTDLAKLNALESKRLAAALKEQVSGFQGILDDLNGNAGGVTALTQLTADLKTLEGFKADQAAGKTIDQDAFTALAQKITSNTDEVYGKNTSDAQDIFASLKAIAGGAITNATNAFNSASGGDSTVAAITSQTNAITSSVGITNDYMRQLLEAVQNGGALANYAASGGVAVYNGRLVQAF